MSATRDRAPRVAAFASPTRRLAPMARCRGLSGFSATQELTFENSTLTYQGAVDGVGIAIAQKALVAEDLASGRLAAPSEIEVRNPVAYYLVYPRRRSTAARVQAFQNWIAAEAGETRRADPLL